MIRPVTPNDAERVCRIWREVFGYGEKRNVPERIWSTKISWDGRMLVAEEEGQVVGTVMIGYDGHRGWLYALAVTPAFRRRGIARALVKEAERALLDLGCAKVNLQVHVDNETGARFWEALGYGREERVSMGKDMTYGPSNDGGH